MSETITTTHGYTIMLTKQHCSELESLKENVLLLQELMTQEYENLVNEHSSIMRKIVENGAKQGYYRDELTTIVGKTYLEWEVIGSTNRYWRMLVQHSYQQTASRIERSRIIEVIKSMNATKITDELLEELREENLHPTHGTLRNIFNCLKNGKETEYKIAIVPLDYTTGDSTHNVKQSVHDHVVEVSVQCNRKQFYTITYQLPTHLKNHTIDKVTKPTLTINEDGEVMLRYAVETSTPLSTNTSILGVDPGKIKPITCAAVDTDGYYSTELTSSKELDRVKDKLDNLYLVKKSLISKQNALRLLLVKPYLPDPLTIQSYSDVTRELELVKDKIIRVKDHLSWLSARDVVSHAIEQDCGVIHVEDLSWLDNTGGKWDHSRTQHHIQHKAGQHGVIVKRVDAHGTSWEYPEEYDTNPAPRANYDPKTRELINSEGKRVDKDYASGIAQACRKPLKESTKGSKRKRVKKTKNSRERVIQPRESRDKFAPTPRRPKRKFVRKSIKRVVPSFVSVLSSSCHESVGTSTTVVNQVVINSDVGKSGDCPLLSCSH